jgi:hypothetical protein
MLAEGEAAVFLEVAAAPLTGVPASDCVVCRRGGRERDAGGEGKRDTEGVEEDELELGAASPLSSLILFFARSLTYMSLLEASMGPGFSPSSWSLCLSSS